MQKGENYIRLNFVIGNEKKLVQLVNNGDTGDVHDLI